MAILSGRNGKVYYSPNGGGSPLAELVAINAFKLSLKTDYEDVTCFGASNKSYIPGMRDISGSLSGFWDSTALEIVQATEATTPGFLELYPNSTEPDFAFSGTAYIDADLDCSMAAPKLSSTFKAAGDWVIAHGGSPLGG